MTADLHCHTSASDAALTRDELVSYAALCGLKRIAITDHDTMKNSFCTAEDEVEVVTGCEFSCFDSDRGNKKVHVLCYYPKKPQLFAEYFKRMSDERNRVGQLMIDKVKKIYPVINEQNTAKFTKDSGTIFKANFMQILSHYGVVKEIYGELYRELFSKSGTCTVEPQYGTLDEVLELIRAARGV
ncbi:MAG: PHP domain-containing protein, partial [Oscillospiraceae bacterium]